MALDTDVTAGRVALPEGYNFNWGRMASMATAVNQYSARQKQLMECMDA